MLPYGVKTFVIVSYFDVKDLTQVILVGNIEGILRYINAAARFFIVHNRDVLMSKKCIFIMDKTEGKNTLTRCYRSYYNLSLQEGILNCSASGKKRDGDDHVVK